MLTNNSVEQINRELLSLKSSNTYNLLEQKRNTIISEDEDTGNPIDNATSVINNAYYFSISRKYTRDPINVVQNYFLFGELMMVWGTFMGGGSYTQLQYTVNCTCPEKFASKPLFYACYFWNNGSATEVAREIVTYNKANHTLTFLNQAVADPNLWPESYTWCFIGKVEKGAT